MIRYALIAVATIAFAACGAEAPPEAAPAKPAPEAKKAEAAPVKAEAAPAAAKAHDHDHAKACVCGAGKAGGTVWCDACGAGYIKGEKTKDKAAVTTALASAGDTAKAAAHDHADGKACTCGVGKSGGTVWCSACGSGYVKGEKTKDKAVVTAALAAAKPTPAAK